MENELVEPQFACSKCGNRIMDDLVWIDDDVVKCTLLIKNKKWHEK
jgi:hypothetical protein